MRSCSVWLSIPVGQAAVTRTSHMCPNNAVRYATTLWFAEHSTAVSSTPPTNKQTKKKAKNVNQNTQVSNKTNLGIKKYQMYCAGVGASKPSAESLGRGLGHKKPSLEAVSFYKTSM